MFWKTIDDNLLRFDIIGGCLITIDYIVMISIDDVNYYRLGYIYMMMISITID